MNTECKHERIQTWRFEDSAEVAGLWSCTDCGRRFEPVAAPTAQPAPLPEFKTSKAGRAEVARFFSQHLGRHDFARYINEHLAADFACAIAPSLHAIMDGAAPLPAREPQPPADWSVINGAAVVAHGLTWAEAFRYLTPARLERGWSAVCAADKSNITATPADKEQA